MNIAEIKLKYRLAVDYLDKKHLKDGFEIINELTKASQNVEVINMLEQLQTTYRFMLKYTVEGIEDPERQTIYRNLLDSTYLLLDDVNTILCDKYSNGFYYRNRRNFFGTKPDISSAIDMIAAAHIQFELKTLVEGPKALSDSELAKNLQLVFDFFLLQEKYNEETISVFQDFFYAEDIMTWEKSLVTSAIILSLLHRFEEKKFNFLFELAQNKQIEISQRAMVGIVFALYKYEPRLKVYPLLLNRLKVMAENRMFITSLENIIIQLIRSKETEKITRKFQDEILPEIARLNPNMRNKLNLESLMNNKQGNDKNPQIKEFIEENSELSKNLKELTNLQIEGADVFMSTFSQLNVLIFAVVLASSFSFSSKSPFIMPRIKDSSSGVISLKGFSKDSSVVSLASGLSVVATV